MQSEIHYIKHKKLCIAVGFNDHFMHVRLNLHMFLLGYMKEQLD